MIINRRLVPQKDPLEPSQIFLAEMRATAKALMDAHGTRHLVEEGMERSEGPGVAYWCGVKPKMRLIPPAPATVEMPKQAGRALFVCIDRDGRRFIDSCSDDASRLSYIDITPLIPTKRHK